MRLMVYVLASVLAMVLLGVATVCATAAGRNHLSPWWIGVYASLLTAFALIAETAAPQLGIS